MPIPPPSSAVGRPSSDSRYGVDAYLDWVEKEGLPVAEDYGIDLFKVETAMSRSRNASSTAR